MKPALIVCFSFLPLLAFAGGGKKYFICDILEKSQDSQSIGPPPSNDSFDGDFGYWDRPFFYKIGKEGKGNKAFFRSGAQSFALKLKGDILSQAFLIRAREQQGFYREIFDIFRFNIKTEILTHSYLYYLDPKDFEKNFNNANFVPYNLPLLFDLLEKPLPHENYVKIGWDKSWWQCYRISALKHAYFQFIAIFKVLGMG